MAASSAGETTCTKTGTSGNDTLNGTAGDDVLCGLGGNDTLNGAGGTDTLIGAGGSDTLSGGSGNDTLSGGTGGDTINGGTDTDTVSYSDSTGGVKANLATDSATGQGTDTLPADENLTGSPQGDSLTGDGGANTLAGGTGNDTLSGGAGTDTLNGGAGTDTASYSSSTGGVKANLATDSATGQGTDTLPADENLTGSPQGDSLTGDGGANTLAGGTGNDTLAGGGGGDILPGGGGNDTEHGAGGNDGMTGGDGSDQLYGEANDDNMDGGPGSDFLNGGTGHNVCVAGDGDTLLDNCDSTPPVLTAFDFTPKTIDTSGSTQQVTVTAHITDDLSGVNGGAFAPRVQFKSPAGTDVYSYLALDSGTDTDGDYTGTATFPQYGAKGDWQVVEVVLSDKAGNNRNLHQADLTAAGYPTTLNQAGAEDTGGPDLTAFDFAPKTIDTSGSGQQVTITAHLTDDLSGVATGDFRPLVQFKSPAGTDVYSYLALDSGTDTDGDYTGTATFPQYGAQGDWHVVEVVFSDKAGNARHLHQADLTDAGYPTTLNQQGADDLDAPVMTAFDFTPKEIDTSGSSQQVTITAHLTDDLSGVAAGDFRPLVQFKSPAGTDAYSYLSLDSGTNTDGDYTGTATIPQFAAQGDWHVVEIVFSDNAGNARHLHQADLTDAGYPTTLHNGPSG